PPGEGAPPPATANPTSGARQWAPVAGGPEWGCEASHAAAWFAAGEIGSGRFPVIEVTREWQSVTRGVVLCSMLRSMAKPVSQPKEKGPVVRELASNRRARHDYHILETFEAGLRLTGTEVKAARLGKVQLKDSFVEVRGGEAWLVGAHISPYSHGNRENHPPERDRKLLLKKRQIDRIMGRSQIKGQTVIPLSVYLKGNW